jgi:hypothetical protein
MTEIDLEPFLDLRRHLEIAHHIPGRIRLRISAGAARELGNVDAKVIDRILGAIDGIDNVRLNALAGSAVVEYRPQKIESSWWETLLTGDADSATALLRRLLED